MSEIAEAAQVFVVAIQGIEVAFKIGKELVNFSLDLAQKLVKFLDAMLRHEKFCGKTSMKTMLKNGVDMECCQVPQEGMKEFRKLAKKYGILYSEVPAGKNGMTDIIFRAEDMPRMNMLFEKMDLGKVKAQSVMDYVKDLSEKEMENIERECISPEDIEIVDSMEKAEKKSVQPDNMMGIGQKDVYVDKEHKEQMEQVLHGMQDKFSKGEQVDMGKFNQAAADIQKNILSNHPGYDQISIATKNRDGFPLLVDETPDRIKVRIPYEMNKFIWLDKKEAFLSEDRKSITAFLKRDRTYIIFDKQNWEVERKQGGRLYQEHYDPVNAKRTAKAKDHSDAVNRSKDKMKTGKENINLNKTNKPKAKAAPAGR